MEPDKARLLALQEQSKLRSERMNSLRPQFKDLENTATTPAFSLPSLYPTPSDLAQRMGDMLREHLPEGGRILEPSAGLGDLIKPLIPWEGPIIAVEQSPTLTNTLEKLPITCLMTTDFLSIEAGSIGLFHGIVMNPPFQNAVDIKHIMHAREMLAEDGLLVAICANGPRQARKLQPLCDSWEELPPDTFKQAGTSVRTVLLTMTI